MRVYLRRPVAAQRLRASLALVHHGRAIPFATWSRPITLMHLKPRFPAYPTITVISHGKQGPVIVAKALPGIETADTDYVVSHLKTARSNTVVRTTRFEDWFKGDEPWPCSSPETLALLKKLEARFPLLESVETVEPRSCIGVASGADSVSSGRNVRTSKKTGFCRWRWLSI